MKQSMRMKAVAAGLLLLTAAAAATASAAVQGNVTSGELAGAINKADAALVPYQKTRISPADIRAVRCVAPDEEPTEFKCRWRQRTQGGWVKRTTWLVIDGDGWRVMDV